MPYRKEQFVNDEIYHITLRGIDNNLIFKDIDDYYRGIFSIYEFNNDRPVEIWKRRKERKKEKTKGRPTSSVRDLLVNILVFCFMPNHIHLLLKQVKDGGLRKFMIKLGSGYGRYFNRKYDRKGYVFQNRFSSVHIENEEQLKTVFTYIHTNPISLIEPNWKGIGIKNPQKVIKFLEKEYKWFSYPDYIGRQNFPSILEKDFLFDLMGGVEGCKKFINNWIMHKKELNEDFKKYPHLFIE